MEITKDIRSAHNKLSKSSIKFLEFVEKNPASLKRSNFSALDWHDSKIKLQSWPTFIDRDLMGEIETASLGLCALLKSLPARFFNNNPAKIGSYFEVPGDLIEIQLSATDKYHLSELLARGDFIISPSGLKCIEFNVSSDLGGLEKPIWESLYLNTDLIKSFLQEEKVKIIDRNSLRVLLIHLADIACNKWASIKKINIVFVIPGFDIESDRSIEKKYLAGIYAEVLSSKSKDLSGEIFFSDYHQLDADSGGLLLGRNRIHVLIEIYGGIVLPEILDHFKKGNVIMFNGPITRLLSNKINLALISENSDSEIFTHEEREMINKYVPWTRKISDNMSYYDGEKINLLEFVISNREKLLIKPSEGSGGSGVHIGCHTIKDDWKNLIYKAVSQKNWIVQEYIESFPFLYRTGESGCSPHSVVWGGFVFGKEFAGSWVRMMPKEAKFGVINRAQGAEEGVVFEVEE